jgi:cytoskeletal protein RodZ
MTDKPWYMRTTDTTNVDKGSPERNEKHLRSLAGTASEEADAVAAHLRAAEAKGVELNTVQRMAMGYTANARNAATQLGTSGSKNEASVSNDDLTPEQRIARGYGA